MDVIEDLQTTDGRLGLRMFWCPGCQEHHNFRDAECVCEPGDPVWTWNGDREKPTVTPSILVRKHKPENRCHLFMRDGMLQFLGDCHHELKGQIVDMEPIE